MTPASEKPLGHDFEDGAGVLEAGVALGQVVVRDHRLEGHELLHHAVRVDLGVDVLGVLPVERDREALAQVGMPLEEDRTELALDVGVGCAAAVLRADRDGLAGAVVEDQQPRGVDAAPMLAE